MLVVSSGIIYFVPFVWQASLGTTKYCSYFLKSMQCPKPDCMYLHELGDEAASFTKEEMQVKKNKLTSSFSVANCRQFYCFWVCYIENEDMQLII